MTEDEFWDHIRATRRADPGAHEERLTQRLAKLPPEEILDFVHLWRVLRARAYRQDLWGAAYLIQCGCSDDGFEYFRDWLILQGRAVYEAAIADPDALAEVLDGETEGFATGEIWIDAWIEATGAPSDGEQYEAFYRALKFRHPKPPELPRLGRQWDFDDDGEQRKRLPRLAALYLGDDEIG